MAFFDNISSLRDKASEAAQAAAKKTKKLAEIAKANVSIYGEEDKIKKAEAELGKLYYAEKGAAPDGAYAAACEKITAAKAAIEVNNERITEIMPSAKKWTRRNICPGARRSMKPSRPLQICGTTSRN